MLNDPGGFVMLYPSERPVAVEGMRPMCFGLPLEDGEQKDEKGELMHRKPADFKDEMKKLIGSKIPRKTRE